MTQSSRFTGAVLALATAALLAAQDPLSSQAAQKLNAAQYVLVSQITSLIVAPFLVLQADARRDFVAIFKSRAGWLQIGALMFIGLAGLAFYNLGLRNAHPVVISAILNLSPFWAALVARSVAGVTIPAGPLVFATSLLVAFAGAMTVAYSQMKGVSLSSGGLSKILQGSWYFAIPVPIFTALSGTLVGLWFKDYKESASISAALFAPAVVLVPALALYLATAGGGFHVDMQAVVLLMAGTISAAGIGRLFYQLALSKTDGDNGFVTMFFMLSPAFAGVFSWALSLWIAKLQFAPNFAYFVGLIVTAAALFFFVRKSKPA